MVAFAVGRKDVPDIEVRQAEKIPEVLFVFVAVKTTARSATVGFDVRRVSGEQRAGDLVREFLTVGRGEGFLLRGHLALHDDIVKVRPTFAVLGVLGVEGQGAQVDVSLGGLLVMTLEACLLDAGKRGGVP